MSGNCTQAENLKEKNTGDPAKEFDHEESADDSTKLRWRTGERSTQPTTGALQQKTQP